MTGMASSTPIGSSQRWSRRAAMMMTMAASGNRAMSGMGTDPATVLEPVLDVSSWNHSAHSPGVSTAVTAITASVAAIARLKPNHSRRTANHRMPRPGVTFVSSGKAHANERPKPMTMAAASRMVMLPPQISGKASSSSGRKSSGRASQKSTASSPAVQKPRKSGHERARSGLSATRNAGEYR